MGAKKKRLEKHKRLEPQTPRDASLLTHVDGGFYVVLDARMQLGAFLQLHIRFRRPQRLVLPEQSQQLLHGGQCPNMRLGELIDGLRKM